MHASPHVWDLASAYRPGSFFVVRSPLLALDTLSARTAVNTGPLSEPVWLARRAELEAELLQKLASPAMRAALFFASPRAFALLQRAAKHGNPPALVRALQRYLFRAAARETPSGLLAGISLGIAGPEDCFTLLAQQQYRAVTTVAPTRLHSLLQELGSRPSLQERVVQRLSSTVALVQGSYRCMPDGKRASLLCIEASAAMRQVVQLAREGASSKQLVRRLVEHGFRAADARASVNELRRLGLLEPAWLPSASGTNALARALEQLSREPELLAEVDTLRDVASCLQLADAAPLGSKLDSYQRASAHLSEGVPDTTQVLSTQLVKPAASLSLSEATRRKLLAAATLVQQVGRPPGNPALRAFVQRFEARYEERLVPLAEALDPDVGIGFGLEPSAAEAWVQDLPLGNPKRVVRTFDELDSVRLRLLSRALAEHSSSCELDDDCLAALRTATAAPSRPTRECFALLTRLARDDKGQLLIVAPILHSAGELLGRYAEADPQLRAELEQLVATEQRLNGRAALADVAHFPLSNTANALVRPALRQYEIPYLGSSGAPPDQQLPLDDLLVGIERGRAQLYSVKLRQRVAVRLLNAHDFTAPGCPAFYRFLGALQDEDSGLVTQWSWGALADAEFLPRVVRGNTILSLASWRLPVAELTRLAELDGAQGFAGVQAVRSRLKLPRWLTRSHDRGQVVDLDNELSVEELLYAATQQASLTVTELLPTPEQLVLSGPEGKFAAELVVPFVRDRVEPASPLPAGFDLAMRPVSQRRFVPGSEWLYAKIYCAPPTLPNVLQQIRRATRDAATPRWFFLPCTDPEPHLRLRWACASGSTGESAFIRLQRALQPFVDSGVVWRWQLDTYEQELERFGGPEHIELAEDVFCADSEATADLLELADGDSELAWTLALLGVDRLFADFGLSLPERAELARNYRDGYAREQRADSRTWRVAGAKYRHCLPQVRDLLWQPPSEQQGVSRQVHDIFHERSQRLLNARLEYDLRWSEGRLSVSRAELLQSFTHLHVLRLLGTSAREHELLLFDFLRRQYSARFATQARNALANT